MKQKISILALIIFSLLNSNAQNKVVTFDGVNDYIDLGSNIGAGIRTMEMWFNPAVAINSNITNFNALVARDNTTTSNSNEFNISFSPSIPGVPSAAGRLRFTMYDNNGINNSVYSNSNSWNANQWYHVAAVVHPSQGMMLFIDGVQQNDTNNYTNATNQLNFPVHIGSWGNTPNRYFNGSIDDVRLSDSALYNSNFTPPCPNLPSITSTIAVWNFNDSLSNQIAIDSSVNANNGVVVGAVSLVDDVCITPTKSNVMGFDGIDDYIDLGSSIAQGIRTIEMWFNPSVTISSSLNNFKALIARDNSTSTANEFNLSFSPANASPTTSAGKLRFTLYNSSNAVFSIYSDSNLWNSNQWYHLAAVIHPSQGMMLFIDGIKQTSSNNYIFAPVQTLDPVTIGSWGNTPNRYFNGAIDDLRFSSIALYSSNFTPPCPDLTSLPSTIGLWNFNDSSNTIITIDSSGNMNNGIIYGASGILDTVCQLTTNTSEIDNYPLTAKVFPNPFNRNITIELSNSNTQKLIRLYSIDGRLIIEKHVSSTFDINTSGLTSGLYFFQVIQNGQITISQKLMKQ